MNKLDFIELKKCPYCGSNKLKVSSLVYQGWSDYDVFNGKVGKKPKHTKSLYGENHLVLTCRDCDELYIEEAEAVVDVEDRKLMLRQDIYNKLVDGDEDL